MTPCYEQAPMTGPVSLTANTARLRSICGVDASLGWES